MIKRTTFIAALLSLSLLTTSNVRAATLSYHPAQAIIGVLAGCTVSGAGVYGLYQQLATFYYGILADDTSEHTEIENARACRRHYVRGVKAVCIGTVASIVAALSQLPTFTFFARR
jgi:hypothetical protein